MTLSVWMSDIRSYLINLQDCVLFEIIVLFGSAWLALLPLACKATVIIVGSIHEIVNIMTCVKHVCILLCCMKIKLKYHSANNGIYGTVV